MSWLLFLLRGGNPKPKRGFNGWSSLVWGDPVESPAWLDRCCFTLLGSAISVRPPRCRCSSSSAPPPSPSLLPLSLRLLFGPQLHCRWSFSSAFLLLSSFSSSDHPRCGSPPLVSFSAEPLLFSARARCGSAASLLLLAFPSTGSCFSCSSLRLLCCCSAPWQLGRCSAFSLRLLLGPAQLGFCSAFSFRVATCYPRSSASSLLDLLPLSSLYSPSARRMLWLFCSAPVRTWCGSFGSASVLSPPLLL